MSSDDHLMAPRRLNTSEIMRPFFSYYGSKWIAARNMCKPQRDIVIEPFAGSAAYSVRWWGRRKSILVDISEDICTLWDYLINATDREIMALPDRLDSADELTAMPDGPRQLVGFWVSKGRAEVSNTLSPWYFRYRNAHDCRVWGPAVKHRISKQLPMIRAWEIHHGSFETAPDIDAHWHIDPPYNSGAGQRYPHSEINYNALADWVRTRRGFIQVCENEGATWLPFSPLCEVVTTRGRRTGAVSREAIFERESDHALTFS